MGYGKLSYTELCEAVIGDKKKRGYTFIEVSNAGGRKRYIKVTPVAELMSIELMGTEIAIVHPDGAVDLDAHGWRTATTREALAYFLPKGWSIWSEKGEWRLFPPEHHKIEGKGWAHGTIPYADGVRFSAAGELTLPLESGKVSA